MADMKDRVYGLSWAGQDMRNHPLPKYMRRTGGVIGVTRVVGDAHSQELIEERNGPIVHVSPIFKHPNFNNLLRVYFISGERHDC